MIIKPNQNIFTNSSRIHLKNSILPGGLEKGEIQQIDSREFSKPRNDTAVPFSVGLGRTGVRTPPGGAGVRAGVTRGNLLSTGGILNSLRFL